VKRSDNGPLSGTSARHALGRAGGPIRRHLRDSRTLSSTSRAAWRRRHGRAADELRSQTAHTGRLHGAETELGWLPDDFYQLSTAADFEEQTLTELADAARRVLIHALTGQDPPIQATA
jgi:hypothetical protein